MSTALTQMRAHVKDPTSICRKGEYLTAGGMETRKHCTVGEEKQGSAQLWLLAFPWRRSPTFSCVALGQESYLI